MGSGSSGSNAGQYRFVGKQEISRLTGLSSDTLKEYRLRKGLLIQGIHWVMINPRLIRYNVTLVLDWMQNQGDPIAHQRAINLYLESLPSNQRKPRR